MRALNLRNCSPFSWGHRFLIFVTADKMKITEYEYGLELHLRVAKKKSYDGNFLTN